jgi:adenine C2-methylase RlmN of 23S rRNA A2503 and tRNA A37
MVADHGFTDAQLRRLWMALLGEPSFLLAALGHGADADADDADAGDASSPSAPLLFSAPPCQRALDRMQPPLPKRLRATLEQRPPPPQHQQQRLAAVAPAPAAPAAPAVAVAVAAMSARAGLVRRSKRGDAVKLLVRLSDGLEVETVVMAYGMAGGHDQEEEEEEDDGDTAPSTSTTTATTTTTTPQNRPQPGRRRRSAQGVRTAVCFSSQYGCRLGCVFCATGKMGVGANLSAGEIVEQAVLARAACLHYGLPAPASALAMGQGEPVCGGNYSAVVSAVRSLTHPARGFGLARRRVTLSTVGAVPSKIVDLARDLPGVSLALSLHAPTQPEREAIVPSAKAAPLNKIMAAVDAYTRHTGQRVFVEYVLLAGINDTVEHARALRELLAGRDVVVNAIPWNPVLAAGDDGGGKNAFEFEAPSPESVAAFHGEVWLGGREGGVPCTVRQERGQDIDGACGQLATAVAQERRRRRQQQQQQGGGGCGGGGGGGGSGKTGGGGGGDLEDAAGGKSRRDQDEVEPQPPPQSLWRRLLALRTS